MTSEQALAFGLLGATVALFIWGKVRYDLIALAAMMFGAVFGIIPHDEVFSGFSNDLIWIIASALLLSAAIARSGFVDRFLGPLLTKVQTASLQAPLFAGLVMVLSMLTKNVGALAMVMPIAIRHAQKTGVSPSVVLMPMAFASLLGGLVTLVGTSPNVIVSGVRETIVGEMFDFAPVGLGVCAVGFVFLAVASRFFRLERTPVQGVDAALDAGKYVTEVAIDENSSCAGLTVEAMQEAAKGEVRVVALISDGNRQSLKPDYELKVGDRLIVEGEQRELERFSAEAKLHLVGQRHRDGGETASNVKTLEGVVRVESSLVGVSAAKARLHERYGISLLAIRREGRSVQQELRSLKFRAGDVAVFKVGEEQAGETFTELGILPLSERPILLGQKRFGYVPIVALGVAIAAVATGVAPIQIAFPAAAAVILLLGVMSMEEAYRSIEGPVLVLLAALIAISESIQRTGGDALIAGFLAQVIGPMPQILGIGVLIVAAMAVTPFLNNAATVLVMAPIAAGIARTLGHSPDAYLMAVAMGAACDFLTPIGHQCNTLVMGPGGYRFTDYWKLGLPLSALVVLTATPLILLNWPL